MPATIFYFSATGNSLFLARKAAGLLGGCRLVSMASHEVQGPVGGPGESVGFAFPVYFVGPPRLVKRYIENLDILPGTYCFAVVTYGGTGMDTLGMLQDLLRAKGLDLSYGCSIKMPDTWLLKYEAPDTGKIGILARRADAKLDAAVSDIKAKKHKKVGRFWKPLSRKFNKVIYTDIAAWDSAFHEGRRRYHHPEISAQDIKAGKL
jgi:hypothetical protein